MAVVAIGTDIVDLERLRSVWENHLERFIERHFTQPEVEYAFNKSDPLPSLGARFAAKEAFQKCWPKSFGWHDVWVEMDGPRPTLKFCEAIAKQMQANGWVAHVSLSHERGHALAMVVLEKP